MKFDKNTRMSICYEDEFGKISIENYKLNEIVKYIAAQSVVDIQLNKDDYRKKKTQFIIIDGKQYNIKTDISIDIKISLSNLPIVYKGYFQDTYETEVKTEVKDFYNSIVGIVEEYAYELDTDMDNIDIEVNKLEILNVYEKEGA